MDLLIVNEMMLGKRVTLVTESESDEKINELISRLRGMDPRVIRTNCNVFIHPDNLIRLIVDFIIVEPTTRELVHSALLNAQITTPLSLKMIDA